MRIRLCMSETRSIADNLRSIYFLKQHCRDNNIEAVLVSLDAKKAFDSVDHGYIEISKNPQQGAGRARAKSQKHIDFVHKKIPKFALFAWGKYEIGQPFFLFSQN